MTARNRALIIIAFSIAVIATVTADDVDLLSITTGTAYRFAGESTEFRILGDKWNSITFLPSNEYLLTGRALVYHGQLETSPIISEDGYSLRPDLQGQVVRARIPGTHGLIFREGATQDSLSVAGRSPFEGVFYVVSEWEDLVPIHGGFRASERWEWTDVELIPIE